MKLDTTQNILVHQCEMAHRLRSNYLPDCITKVVSNEAI
jgi:hypothetical protein